MGMKAIFVQIVIFMFLMGCPPVSSAQVDAGDPYTNEQCTECHEEMVDDHASSVHGNTQRLECHTQVSEYEHEALAPCRL